MPELWREDPHGAGLLDNEDFFDEMTLVPESRRKQVRVQLWPVFSAEGFLAAVNYPVIVEAWENKRCGRGKRAYLAAFTEDEREQLGSWHTQFKRWHLRAGTPKRIMARVWTIALLKRAVDFFAQI